MAEKNKTRGLRSIIDRKLIIISAIITVFLLGGLLLSQRQLARTIIKGRADDTFSQVETILKDNWANLDQIDSDYDNNALSRARQLAYLLQRIPSVIENQDTEALKAVAAYAGVDVINIINSNGRIVLGTDPSQIGTSFDTREEFEEFLPMLTDQALEICQKNSTFNESDELIQYFAVWNDDRSFILQIGLNAIKTLSSLQNPYYIVNTFSRLTPASGQRIFVLSNMHSAESDGSDADTVVLSSTDPWMKEKTIAEVGLQPVPADGETEQEYRATINGERSLVFIRMINDTCLGCSFTLEEVYGEVHRTTLYYALGILLVVFILYLVVSHYVSAYVVRNIDAINWDLQKVTKGDLSVRIHVENSSEFSDLSNYTNAMIQSMADNQHRIEQERDMDMLTGLLNRRGLDNELQRIIIRNAGLGRCALVMVDSDGLKEINDRHGHTYGDAYLKEIARILSGAAGENCICARIGGDQFVLFYYDYESRKTLEKTIAGIVECQDGHTLTLMEGVEVPLEFSLGVSYEMDPLDLDEMMRKADLQMYEDKRQRHNRK